MNEKGYTLGGCRGRWGGKNDAVLHTSEVHLNTVPYRSFSEAIEAACEAFRSRLEQRSLGIPSVTAFW